MTHISLIGLIFLAIASCTTKVAENRIAITEVKDSTIHCGSDLSFDKIEHFRITEISGWRTIDKAIILSDNQVLKLLYQFEPKELADPLTSLNFSAIGFTEWEVPQKNYKKICEVFNEPSEYADSTACSPEFQDIIIFRNKNKLTGFAKLCFRCGHSMVLVHSTTAESVRSVNLLKLKDVLN